MTKEIKTYRCEITGQEVHFSIPRRFKKVNVNVSGGADSSMLFNMTIDYLMEFNRNDVVLTATTCSNHEKNRLNGIKAMDVIEYTLNRTGFTNFDMHYSYYRDTPDKKFFHQVENKLILNGRANFFISGITKNPPPNTVVENSEGKLINMDDARISDRDGVRHNDYKNRIFFAYYHPLINVDKKFVSSMYDYFGIRDMLSLTRSCEYIAKPHEDVDEVASRTCGKCWWCLERKWAFGEY